MKTVKFFVSLIVSISQIAIQFWLRHIIDAQLKDIKADNDPEWLFIIKAVFSICSKLISGALTIHDTCTKETVLLGRIP